MNRSRSFGSSRRHSSGVPARSESITCLQSPSRPELPDVPSNGAGVARRGPLGVDVRRAMSRLRRRQSRIVACVAAGPAARPRSTPGTPRACRSSATSSVVKPSADQQDRCGSGKRFECTSRPRIADVIGRVEELAREPGG